MYDVMAVDRRCAGAARGAAAGASDGRPGAPTATASIDGDEVVELAPGARRPRPDLGLPLLRLPDRRRAARADGPRRGRALRRGLRERRCEVVELIEEGGRARGRRVRDAETRRASSRSRADNVVNATGVWADRMRPEELHDEAEVPRIRPEPRHAHHAAPRAAAARRRARSSRPAAGARSSRCPGSGRRSSARPTTTTTARPRPLRAGRRATSSTCSTPRTRFFGTDLTAGDIAGAYAGVRPLISTGDPKKSVDISRKAELYETSSGMITITGGKLTTWRRMAKMAVDRLVEREARDAPCRTHEIPLGQAVDPDELPARRGRRPRTPTPASPAATATPRGTSWRSPRERGELAAADRRRRAARPAGRGRATPPGASRRASSPTSLLRRTRLALLAARARDRPRRDASRAASPRRWRPSSAGTSAARPRRRGAFLDEAAAEGIVAGG